MNSSTDRSAVRNWLFRCLSVEDVLDRIEGGGVAVRATSDPRAVQRVLSLEGFSAEVRRSAMQALPAYLAFFCLENAIRELVSERLTENHGPDWWTECTTSGLQKKVQDRQTRKANNAGMSDAAKPRSSTPTLADLKTLIRENWTDFEDLLPDQHWVTARLDELEASRNIIAHSNVLDKRELDRMKMYLEDWIRQVG